MLAPAAGPRYAGRDHSLPPVTAAEQSAAVFLWRSKTAHTGVARVGQGVWWGRVVIVAQRALGRVLGLVAPASQNASEAAVRHVPAPTPPALVTDVAGDGLTTRAAAPG